MYRIVLCTLAGAALLAPAHPAKAAAGASMIEEITVTARKREETTMEVPGAVSALSGDAMDDLVIDGMQDALRHMTGVLLVSGGPDYLSDISMRGQGGGRNGFSETATGIYRDGIYIAGGGFGGRSFNRMDLFDVEKFEVFRGPQGALYGRNAVGGAANVITRKPTTDDRHGRIKAGYSDPSRSRVEAVANLPISGNFAVRVGGFYDNATDGFVDIVGGKNGIDRQKYRGARIAAAGDLLNSISMDLTYEYYESDAPGFGPLGYRATTYNGMALDPSPFKRVMSDVGGVNIKQHDVFLNVKGEIPVGDWHLKAHYRNRTGDRTNEDLDHFLGFQGISFGGNEVVLFAEQSEDFDKVGMEFFVTSAAESSITWIAGIEYQQFQDDVSTTNRGNAPIAPLRAAMRTDASTEDLDTWSVFGGTEFTFSERISLGLEARVQQDRKDFSFDRTAWGSNSLALPFSLDQSDTWNEVTGTATLKYELASNQMVFGRIATGYRPGGFNTGIPSDIPDADKLIPYDPESAISYEVGLKGRYLDNQLNTDASVWYMQTSDVQVVTQASPTLTTFILQNGGDSTSWGAELGLSGTLAVGPGNLYGRLGLSHNDGEFDKGTTILNLGVVTDIGGNRLNRTRDITANLALTYTQSLSNGLVVFATVSATSENGGYENADNSRKLDNYSLFDLRLGLESDQWRVSLYSQNLTDEIYRLQTISSNEYFNARRVLGVDVTWNWSK